MKIYHTMAEVMALDWEVNQSRGNAGAVYMVVNNATGEILYVGQTSAPCHRLCPSIHPVYRRGQHDLYILRVPSYVDRRILEGNLIDLFQPTMNQRGGTMLTQEDILDRVYNRTFNF